MSEVTTTRGGFPVIDITHKPKRLQRDNLIQAGTACIDAESDSSQDCPVSSVPLHNVTIERAIQYYESHATGELSTLYENTALWLRKLMSVGMGAVYKAEERIRAESEAANEAEKSD